MQVLPPDLPWHVQPNSFRGLWGSRSAHAASLGMGIGSFPPTWVAALLTGGLTRAAPSDALAHSQPLAPSPRGGSYHPW